MKVRALGLMSGTSLDGIDAALVRFDDQPPDLEWTLERFLSVPYSADQRERIHAAIAAGSAESLCRLHAHLGDCFADAALALCHEADVAVEVVDVIGSHGQTVWHEPPAAGVRGATLQLGCPATIAERTGIPVVSDFRTRDVAAGGQGAPLVPWADRTLYARPDRVRVLVNIGGMANLTRVPLRGSLEPLLAFDTGPGNALIDAAVERATEGEQTYDADGAWAAAGTVSEDLLAGLLVHPFFAQEPPRSTGREVFGRDFVDALIRRQPRENRSDWSDLIATLTALTAHTIADSVRRWIAPRGADELIVTGGGAHNPVLLQRLRQLLVPLPVLAGQEAGIHPDAKEAIAFAGLAWAFLNGLPGNVPEATGAAGPRILGSFTPGSRPVQMRRQAR